MRPNPVERLAAAMTQLPESIRVARAEADITAGECSAKITYFQHVESIVTDQLEAVGAAATKLTDPQVAQVPASPGAVTSWGTHDPVARWQRECAGAATAIDGVTKAAVSLKGRTERGKTAFEDGATTVAAATTWLDAVAGEVDAAIAAAGKLYDTAELDAVERRVTSIHTVVERARPQARTQVHAVSAVEQAAAAAIGQAPVSVKSLAAKLSALGDCLDDVATARQFLVEEIEGLAE